MEFWGEPPEIYNLSLQSPTGGNSGYQRFTGGGDAGIIFCLCGNKGEGKLCFY